MLRGYLVVFSIIPIKYYIVIYSHEFTMDNPL